MITLHDGHTNSFSKSVKVLTFHIRPKSEPISSYFVSSKPFVAQYIDNVYVKNAAECKDDYF